MADYRGPVGECIYCGAKEYAPGSNRRLADEHVIPLAIKGNLILQEASCQACERVTGRMESIALNNHLQAPRRRLGMRGRTRPSKQASQIPILIPGEDEKEKPVLIDAEDHPSALFLPVYADSPIVRALKGEQISTAPVGMFIELFGAFDDDRKDALEEKYGIKNWSGMMEVFPFARMLAKIAHSYAIASLGLGGFNPILGRLLRNPNRHSEMIMHYIGGIAARPPETEALHLLRTGIIQVAGHELVGVSVQLFAKFNAPVYVVVVGVPVGRTLPLHLSYYAAGDAPLRPGT